MNNLPEELNELKNTKQWVCYHMKWDEQAGKFKKLPVCPVHVNVTSKDGRQYDCYGYGAKADNPDTWGTFDDAVRMCQIGTVKGKSIDGIGFEFANGYAGIDLDYCFDSQGVITPEAAAIVEKIDSYTEYSPSGKGLHIIVKTDLPALPGIRDDSIGLEIYNAGRFFTVTGNVYGFKRHLNARSQQFTEFRSKYIQKQKKPENGAVNASQRGAVKEQSHGTVHELWEKAFRSKNGAEIWALYNGDISSPKYTRTDASGRVHQDSSIADLSLCSHLAYWTNGDRYLMDQMFRESGLYRDKWEREDYRENTLNKALEGFSPYIPDVPAYGSTTTQPPVEPKKELPYIPEVYSMDPQGGVGADSMIDPTPGLLTFEDAVNAFKTADDRYLKLKRFPNFSDTVKIRTHDSIVIAADTGGGKSSLAINFIDDLSEEYPVIYFNLEMDELTILQRMVSIHSGMKLSAIEKYKRDPEVEKEVNKALETITSRKPIQILKDVYTLEGIAEIIHKSTAGREEPTIVVIDHSLLVTTENKNQSRYDRFTYISENLRQISRKYNIVMFVLLQQSREGKKKVTEKPTNSSLKESGSWENDATHVTFLWYDTQEECKKLIVTKSRRGGDGSEFVLAYNRDTQSYEESTGLDMEEIMTDYYATDPDDVPHFG